MVTYFWLSPLEQALQLPIFFIETHLYIYVCDIWQIEVCVVEPENM